MTVAEDLDPGFWVLIPHPAAADVRLLPGSLIPCRPGEENLVLHGVPSPPWIQALRWVEGHD